MHKQIQEALQKVSNYELHNFNGNLAVTSKDIIGSVTVATGIEVNYTHIFANAPTWLTQLLEENKQLRGRLDTAKRGLEWYATDDDKGEIAHITLKSIE